MYWILFLANVVFGKCFIEAVCLVIERRCFKRVGWRLGWYIGSHCWHVNDVILDKSHISYKQESLLIIVWQGAGWCTCQRLGGSWWLLRRTQFRVRLHGVVFQKIIVWNQIAFFTLVTCISVCVKVCQSVSVRTCCIWYCVPSHNLSNSEQSLSRIVSNCNPLRHN
jgi:hypothetical protein